ncbi:hypothetical protein NPA07_03250 [Mycoplasmopsis caviae]|uniref:Uncharacterized protein n=1 Tax=Mycoplasmopsis caviae TaxID=55603 RepID=A0A3P8KCT6_9BACT|nr:hypothetical protein [Mycoplasmopsis caviae]UUD34813.1 hypothetical protein NPA07_03250 [Mycoplasmopsis caviae]VDR42334.1 Uncharacterised protein [Mycoplasmopsis caviae]
MYNNRYNNYNNYNNKYKWNQGQQQKIVRKPLYSKEQFIVIGDGLKKSLDPRYYANPKFDVEQMKQIQWGLENNLDVSKYADPKFYAEQMEEIRLGLVRNLDVSIYADPKFDVWQMKQIRLGLKSGVDVSIYADPKYTADDMRAIQWELDDNEVNIAPYVKEFDFLCLIQIAKGLKWNLDVSKYALQQYDNSQMQEIRNKMLKEQDVQIIEKIKQLNIDLSKFDNHRIEMIKLGVAQNLDVTIYAKEEFNWDQMNQIRSGLRNKLDVSKYADPKFKGDQMREIKTGLRLGLNVDIYARPEFDFLQMMFIRDGIEQKISVAYYARPEFDGYKMFLIKQGLISGLDVSHYADPKFSAKQMEQILLGLENGLDVSIYSKVEFDADQMREIRLGQQNKLDVSKYADPKFDVEQMHQIRFGLESLLDASIYAKVEISAEEMKIYRTKLQDGKDDEVINEINKRFGPSINDTKTESSYDDDNDVNYDTLDEKEYLKEKTLKEVNKEKNKMKKEELITTEATDKNAKPFNKEEFISKLETNFKENQRTYFIGNKWNEKLYWRHNEETAKRYKEKGWKYEPIEDILKSKGTKQKLALRNSDIVNSETGEVKKVKHYWLNIKNGELDSIQLFFDKDGKLARAENWKMGKPMAMSRDEWNVVGKMLQRNSVYIDQLMGITYGKKNQENTFDFKSNMESPLEDLKTFQKHQEYIEAKISQKAEDTKPNLTEQPEAELPISEEVQIEQPTIEREQSKFGFMFGDEDDDDDDDEIEDESLVSSIEFSESSSQKM